MINLSQTSSDITSSLELSTATTTYSPSFKSPVLFMEYMKSSRAVFSPMNTYTTEKKESTMNICTTEKKELGILSLGLVVGIQRRGTKSVVHRS